MLLAFASSLSDLLGRPAVQIQNVGTSRLTEKSRLNLIDIKAFHERQLMAIKDRRKLKINKKAKSLDKNKTLYDEDADTA